MGLTDMAPNDLANLLTVGSAAVGSILLICFKSKCTNISLCFGLWACDRNVSDESDEENQRTNKNGNESRIDQQIEREGSSREAIENDQATIAETAP